MPEDTLFRRAGPADAPAVRALTRAAYAGWAVLIGREPAPMTADYAAAVRTHRIDLLYDAALLVGLIEMVPEPACLLVENLAVAPAAQGQGHGKRLLRHAETVAAENGLDALRLYTNLRFERNIAFYLRQGYAIERQEEIGGRTAVHMRKSLPKP